MTTEASAVDVQEQRAPRLSAALFHRSPSGFSTMAAMSSNVKAIEAALMFSNGLAPFVTLYGPSGWGKTHLLQAAATVVHREFGLMARVQGVTQWFESGARWDHQAPLILDDAHLALNRARLKQSLRLALERRVRAGRMTMLAFSTPKMSRAIKGLLPNARGWVLGPISEPSPVERELVTRHMAGIEGLTLAGSIHRFFSKQATWDGRTMIAALRRLKLVQSRWTDAEDVLRALGVVSPHLEGSGWDLRDYVHETLTRFLETKVPDCSSPNLAQDLSVYFMIDRMGLSERDVASYFGQSPGEAYVRATRIGRDPCAKGEELRTECAAVLVASLDP